MKFEVGEKVRFLHEDMEGIVQEVHGKRIIVLVDDFDDFEVSADEIVKIHHAEPQRRAPEKTKKPVELPPSLQKPKYPYLAITRTDGGKYNLILVNATDLDLLFTAFTQIRSRTSPINASGIKAGATRLLGRLSPDQFHELRSVLIQLLYYQDEASFNPKDPGVFEIKVRMENLDRRMEMIPRLKAEGWIYSLGGEEEAEGAAAGKNKKEFEYKGLRLDREAPPNEVDLHIEKLSRDHLRMEPSEMLQLQIKTFQKAMADAIAYGAEKIVFIHGSGKGILKKEILFRLEDYPQVASFGTADQVKYGLGATEVIFH